MTPITLEQGSQGRHFSWLMLRFSWNFLPVPQVRMTFLLITVTYLCAHTLMDISQVNCQPVLDMAFNAFDDQYIGCTEDMENIIKSKLLRQEKLRHKVFSKRWEAAKKQWNNNKKNLSLPRGFKDENGIAILAYTSGGEIPLYQEFNKAVREAGKSRAYYLKHFPFKALHFYLTRALQLLKRDCAEMYEMEVYRGVRSLRYQPGKRGGMVRFGTFASSSLDRNVAHRFGSATFFTIRTCFGVPIADFSYIRDEEEVLIPVYERFRVCNFTQDKNSNLFVLHSTNRTFSRYNCVYIEGKKGRGWA
ncbi:ecto-ADP-ribosyltransferase 5-like isoform X1 [Malaclemys terrapin pileata]|uniref:ecto-ADP-ribosyltransferase 5-like isoform X1 n=2 Tax=Malaclemys terrapin pileata TaxID=2991368 RepID=UPI0023A86DEB|nr:ecto-ADP-ribosyltransferase 5-like isoform X1 [Malaclemys terrapin pileata]